MHRKGGQGRTQCACRRVSRADLLRRRRSGGAGAAGPPRAEGCEHPWAPPHLQSRPRSAPRSDMPLGSKPQLSRLSNSAFFSQVKICPKKQAARRLPAPRLAHSHFCRVLSEVKAEAISALPQATKTFPHASGCPQPIPSYALHTSRGTSSRAPRVCSEHPLCMCLTWGSALSGTSSWRQRPSPPGLAKAHLIARDAWSVTGLCLHPWRRPAGSTPGPRPPPGPGSRTPATCSRISHKNITQTSVTGAFVRSFEAKTRRIKRSDSFLRP